MKFRTTRKAIIEGCPNVKYAGYCDLVYLLYNHEPNAYTCGIYGWNFDVYVVYGVTICTGYRGMPGERLEGIREYEDKAQKIISEASIPWETKKQAVEMLLLKFCKLNGGVAQ